MSGQQIAPGMVYVATIHQARCLVHGCDWAGELTADRSAAAFDRKAHLAEHQKAAGK